MWQPAGDRPCGRAGPVESRAPRHGATFFSWQAHTLQHTTHRGHTDPHPPPLLKLSTELFQGGIGLGLDQLPDEGQGGGVAARLAAAGMRARGNLPRRAPPVQQLLEERLAHAEESREGPLRAKVLIVGAQDFLSKVERIRSHA